MQLLPRFMRASQQAAAQAHAADDGSEEEDEETAKGMARLFAEVGEAFCGLIATGPCPHDLLYLIFCCCIQIGKREIVT
jgi:hypothetical protein